VPSRRTSAGWRGSACPDGMVSRRMSGMSDY
jgi:hypothetical protein